MKNRCRDDLSGLKIWTIENMLKLQLFSEKLYAKDTWVDSIPQRVDYYKAFTTREYFQFIFKIPSQSALIFTIFTAEAEAGAAAD